MAVRDRRNAKKIIGGETIIAQQNGEDVVITPAILRRYTMARTIQFGQSNTFKADTANGQNTLKNTSGALFPGQPVSGAGIQSGTTIATANNLACTATMSNTATADASQVTLTTDQVALTSDGVVIIYFQNAGEYFLPPQIMDPGSSVEIWNVSTGNVTIRAGSAAYLNDVLGGSVTLGSQYSKIRLDFLDTYHAYYVVAPGSTIIDTYTANDTWVKRANLVAATAIAIGGGGGGASGRRGATSSVRYGGQGGASAGRSELLLPAAILGSTVAITFGAKGTGGAAPTTDDTDGTNGTAGGDSSFGFFVVGKGGGGGNASVALAAPAGGIAGTGATSGVSGASPNLATGASAPSRPLGFAPGSGGAGGSLDSGNAKRAPSAGGTAGLGTGTLNAGPAGSNSAGSDATALGTGDTRGGGGGGGGDANATGGGYAGGKATSNGGGGGGAGSGINGSQGGNGGDGANGEVIIVSHF